MAAFLYAQNLRTIPGLNVRVSKILSVQECGHRKREQAVLARIQHLGADGGKTDFGERIAARNVGIRLRHTIGRASEIVDYCSKRSFVGGAVGLKCVQAIVKYPVSGAEGGLAVARQVPGQTGPWGEVRPSGLVAARRNARVSRVE